MFACCNYCYAKYIREDGTIDEAVLAEAKERWKAYIAEKKPHADPVQIARLLAQEPCRCSCHKVGTNISH